MNATSTMQPFGDDSREETAPHATRPLYWSVRRELWENRSIYAAPIIVGVVVVIGFMVSTIGMPQRRRAVLLLDPAQQRAIIGQPYDFAAMALFLTAFIVSVFYCLDALHGERRDRSILFWKSLPVADRTVVLSKAFVPLAILPLLTFAIVLVTQFLMLLWTTVVLLPSGLSATTWSRIHLVRHSPILLYGLVVVALWHAPIYGWLLLVSAWARRATFVWAVVPIIAAGVLDQIIFHGTHVCDFLKERFLGGFARAFDFKSRGVVHSFSQLRPGRFLATPGLWAGLALAAVFLYVAVRLRRDRAPL